MVYKLDSRAADAGAATRGAVNQVESPQIKLLYCILLYVSTIEYYILLRILDNFAHL